jgi:uncharacterized protein (DUF885 family)
MSIAIAATALAAAFLATAAAAAQPGPPTPSSQLVALVGTDYLEHNKATDISLQMKFGLPTLRLPDVSLAEEEREAEWAKAQLARLEAAKPAELSHSETLSLDILRRQLQFRADAPRFYWLSFAVTPYNSPIGTVNRLFEAMPLPDAAAAERYAGLVKQLPAFFDALRVKVEGQAQRGIRLPQPEVDVVAGFMRSLGGAGAASPYAVKPARLASLPKEAATQLTSTVDAAVAKDINPRLAAFASYLAVEYRKQAPEAVGVGQYPGGQEYYAWLVKWYTTMDVTPQQVHDTGVSRVSAIEAEMAKVRERLGFKGTAAQFRASLKANTRFFPRTPEAIGEVLTGHARRIEPQLEAFFRSKPKAPYGVRRLQPELEASQTFGGYYPPTATEPGGYYYFNGSNLKERSLLNAAALTYHELAPGHHFQIAGTYENPDIPPFQRETYDVAYTEGWGEYASMLAGEMGMYEDPYDLYGRLSMEMFIAVRLVVDTGMNAFGWPRARAIAYMREREMETDTQIASESLRYSCDIPGQALGYKMGAIKIVELREKARKALGRDFDIRRFHAAVLGSGSLPMTTLERQIDWFIEEEGK